MDRISNAQKDMSEWVWKWRCKISPPNERPSRTLKEIESFDSSTTGDVKKQAENTTPTTQAKVNYWYEGPKSEPSSGAFDWQKYPPKVMRESVAKSIEEYAISVYKVKDTDKIAVGSRYPLRTHQIYIYDLLLVEALEPILKKHGTHVDVHDHLQMKAPFAPFYHSMSDILVLYKTTPDKEPLKHLLELLIKVLDDTFFDIKKQARSLRAQGLINFEHAWTYFPNGTILYTYGRNSEMLSEVVECVIMGVRLRLTVKVLVFDGNGFVWRNTQLYIPWFEGNIPVTELTHYPLEFHGDPEGIKRQLTTRGKIVLDLQGLHYRTYDGVARDSKENSHNVEGRILIDVVGYNKYHLAQGKREADDPETKRNAVTKRVNVKGSEGSDSQDSKVTLKRLSEEEQASNKEEMLKKEHLLMFVGPLIEGYALKNKLWLTFYVEDILPMEWNSTAFDHLVYDEQQKDLVMSFVEHHGNKQAAFDDVIVGKGQGLVMLLSGPPGTGKTLTAEAVADKTHRPLFYLQAEDLGISAATLGANIKRLFAMAIDWQAVILLDEADVFMAERNPNDIRRNELVSIFLRELEYFRGIIFLTTNLYHTIDSAFKSRVNLHLLFKPLTADARRVVWEKFLGRLSAPEEGNKGGVEKNFAEEDTKELALWRMNGREIKNAVKMAQLWCDHKGYTLTLEKLENAIKATSPHSGKEGDHDTSLYD